MEKKRISDLPLAAPPISLAAKVVAIRSHQLGTLSVKLISEFSLNHSHSIYDLADNCDTLTEVGFYRGDRTFVPLRSLVQEDSGFKDINKFFFDWTANTWSDFNVSTYLTEISSFNQSSYAATVAETEYLNVDWTYKGCGGCVLLPSGKVFFVPEVEGEAYIIDPAKISSVKTLEGFSLGSFRGGVLLKSGKIFCTPHDSISAQVYDLSTESIETFPTSFTEQGSFYGSVLLPDGKVFSAGFNRSHFGLFDCDSMSYTDIGTILVQGAFAGCVLTADNKVVCVPYNESRIAIYDPVSNTVTYGPPIFTIPKSFSGGVLLPNGKVLLVSYNSPSCVVDCTYWEVQFFPYTYKFSGGILLPDGTIFCVPVEDIAVILNPVSLTSIEVDFSFSGKSPYISGTLLNTGSILLAPASTSFEASIIKPYLSNINLSLRALTSPYLNKL
jgi:hypothetical protein